MQLGGGSAGVIALMLSACVPAGLVPPAAPVGLGDFAPETVDLEEVALGDPYDLDPWNCHILVGRAHEAVRELEAHPTKENRPARWRLHALAAECSEYDAIPRPPYYGLVGGLTVSLHDLRNAQLLREDPTLGSDGPRTVTGLRRPHAEWLLQHANPAFVDVDAVLALLDGPAT